MPGKRSPRRSQFVSYLLWCGALIVLALIGSAIGGAATATESRPGLLVDNLKSQSSDGEPMEFRIPILRLRSGNIVGTTERSLLLNLERAYVTSFHSNGLQKAGSIQLDFETGKPWRIVAPITKRYVGSERPPSLSRMVTLGFDNAKGIEGLQFRSDHLAPCVGKDISAGLREYNTSDRSLCDPFTFPGGERFIASYSSTLSLVVSCWHSSNVSPCSLSVPFEGLVVEITFDQSRLTDWSAVIEFATAFLKSKQK